MAKKKTKQRKQVTSKSPRSKSERSKASRRTKRKTSKKTGKRRAGKRSRTGRKAARTEEELPEELRGLPDDAQVILAARGMVLFPHVVLPIVVGREQSVRAIQAATRSTRTIGILLQRDETA